MTKPKIFNLLLFLTLSLCHSTVFAQTERLDSVMINGHMRRFKMVLPTTLKADAPMVMVLHGYSSSYLKKRTYMDKAAEAHGFALCVPDGLKDPAGKRSWNVGYPKQEGWKMDDVQTVCHLAAHVQKKYHLSRANTFLTGMSNGGEMCYLLAYRNQTTFRALASISGLTLMWMYKELKPTRAVPFMEVHGTEDRTSEWAGDLANRGGWGAYLPVPTAVNAIVALNRCTHEEVTRMESRTPANGRSVVLHRFPDGDSGCEVWLYEVVGGKHSWHDADIDTGEEVWRFFSKYLK